MQNATKLLFRSYITTPGTSKWRPLPPYSTVCENMWHNCDRNLRVYHQGYRCDSFPSFAVQVYFTPTKCSDEFLVWLGSYDGNAPVLWTFQRFYLFLFDTESTTSHFCAVDIKDRSPGVERPEYEADHSIPAGAEVKNRVQRYLHSSIPTSGVVVKLWGNLSPSLETRRVISLIDCLIA